MKKSFVNFTEAAANFAKAALPKEKMREVAGGFSGTCTCEGSGTQFNVLLSQPEDIAFFTEYYCGQGVNSICE